MSERDHRSPQAAQYRKLYNTARWHRTRSYQLRHYPLCERCKAKGYISQATVCHHIDKDSKLDPERFFHGPYQSLCTSCHDSDAQQEERIGFSTAVGTDGWPTDNRHPSNRRAALQKIS